MQANSRGSSRATPWDLSANGYTPQGVAEAHPWLRPLSGSIAKSSIPGVSLCSTPGYSLASLRVSPHRCVVRINCARWYDCAEMVPQFIPCEMGILGSSGKLVHGKFCSDGWRAESAEETSPASSDDGSKACRACQLYPPPRTVVLRAYFALSPIIRIVVTRSTARWSAVSNRGAFSSRPLPSRCAASSASISGLIPATRAASFKCARSVS